MGTEKRGIFRWRACKKVQIFWEGHKHLDHILIIIWVYQVILKKEWIFFWSSQKTWTLACDSKEGFNWPKLQKISSMFPDGKPVETLKLLSLTQGHQNLINSYLQLILQFYESIPIMNARQLPDKLPPSMSPWSFQLLSCSPSTTGLALRLLLLCHNSDDLFKAFIV